MTRRTPLMAVQRTVGLDRVAARAGARAVGGSGFSRDFLGTLLETSRIILTARGQATGAAWMSKRPSGQRPRALSVTNAPARRRSPWCPAV